MELKEFEKQFKKANIGYVGINLKSGDTIYATGNIITGRFKNEETIVLFCEDGIIAQVYLKNIRSIY